MTKNTELENRIAAEKNLADAQSDIAEEVKQGKKYISELADPAAAMELLKKCMERIGCDCSISMCVKPRGFEIIACNNDLKILAEIYAETLEFAICLFAQKLFSK
jgi:hypothetical protein